MGNWISGMKGEFLNQGLRLGSRHPDAEAGLNCSRISRDNFADCPTSTSGVAASRAAAPMLRRSRSVGHVGR